MNAKLGHGEEVALGGPAQLMHYQARVMSGLRGSTHASTHCLNPPLLECIEMKMKIKISFISIHSKYECIQTRPWMVSRGLDQA